ncbi:MAG: hypothetical protein ACREDL_15775, partial [Bradyrhizobium sp.]
YIPGENAFVDLLELPDGKWAGEALSFFRANRDGAKRRRPISHSAAQFVTRLFKGDLIALDLKGQRAVMIVHRLDAANNRFKLAAHNEAGNF